MVQDRIRDGEVLKDHVRPVSISFDRINDSPEILARYASKFREPGLGWHFLQPDIVASDNRTIVAEATRQAAPRLKR